MPTIRKDVRRDRRPRGETTGWPLWHFLVGFIKHPVMVGSVIPSSKALINRMLGPVDWANCRLFVEYGPGVGTFTGHLLERLPADAVLIAIDTNAEFTRYLEEKFADRRLRAVTGSAEDVRRFMNEAGFEEADYVLSGLPFSTLPPGVGPRIAAETAAALKTGGAFLVYQFSPKVRDFLVPHFRRIDRDFEWINVPPAHLFWAWKDAGASAPASPGS